MRLPFISRDAHDAAITAERRRADAEHENAQYLRRSLADLTARYYELAAPKPATVTTTIGHSTGHSLEPVVAALPPDAVTVTIREQAGRDQQLSAHLRKYARELKASGLNEDQIVGKLVEWQTSEPADHAASA